MKSEIRAVYEWLYEMCDIDIMYKYAEAQDISKTSTTCVYVLDEL